MFRFGLKVGLTAGAVYYLSETGIWRQSEESNKIYGQINTAIAPYVKDVSLKLPFEIPELPKNNQISYVSKQYWNRGVMATFQYLSDLPNHASYYMQKGYNAALQNEEIKKFIDSFSTAPKNPTEKN